MKQLALALQPPPVKPRASVLRSFHVRSHVTVPEAQAGERRASAQEGRVLAWLRDCAAGSRWTPTQVWHALGGEDGFGPKTSVRRALTTLTVKRLLLHHAADREVGPFGAKESKWSLA